ncbi:MAG: hypothetical protein H0U54_10070 [Acidobacteria bacterium]|nr:hypothetical protein [Acidobacteriota bacterium]
MNRKINTCRMNQPGKQLKEIEGFHKGRALARLWIVVLFLVLGAALPLSRSVQAQGLDGHHPASKVLKTRTGRMRIVRPRSKTQKAEGVVITAKGAKLKPGYKFIRIDNNTVEVAGNNGRGPKTLRCRCNTGNAAHAATSGSGRTSGGCKMAIFGDLAMCENKSCDGGCRMKIK